MTGFGINDDGFYLSVTVFLSYAGSTAPFISTYE
jgi:hypothetical protein